ncbi:MAG TPA: YdcF family protein [Sphingobacterium sp.]|nr:YdcF family protein [Sphingobacterium sp.]
MNDNEMTGWRSAFKVSFLFFAFCWMMTYAQASVSTTENITVSRDSVIRNKLFYFLTTINSDKKLNSTIEKNKVLKGIYTAQLSRIVRSLQHCKSGRCYAESIYWKEQEITSAGTELLKLLKNKETRNKVIGKLKESGHYTLYHNLSDTAFIRAVWESNAQGINRIFRVYLGGIPPKRYAGIDSISYKHDDPVFTSKVYSALRAVTAKMKNESVPFFELPLEASLAMLYINGRDEMARYEPLTAGHNAPSFEQAKHTDWPAYKYSMLLVPGSGPQEPGVRMTEKGMNRCKMAAERFRKGLAPFIVVSGGHVYPFRTPICEAVEMKKYMIEALSIPAEAIIIEPHARHTTTNIRNASRLLYRFNMPDTKLGLIVTDAAQTKMIENLAERCLRELGYVPYKNVKVLNENEVEFETSTDVFQINLEDILDP